ncbi:MAG: adenylate cyclase [Thermoleophilaceae bacterium]|nr:adenylate cyclase [Thermoleophilaceae bacterium]
MLLAAAAGTVAVVLLGYGFDVLKRTEFSTVDTRFDIRGTRKPPRELVFVKIDDETFNDLNTTFPLPRQLHAKVIDRLKADGARAIAYDVQFTEPSSDPNADDALIQSVRDAGNVVLATTEVDSKGKTKIFGGADGLAYSKAVPSDSLFPNDPGGVFRRTEFRIDGLTTFPLAAAGVFRGRRIDPPGGASAWIDFAGPPGTVKSISFGKVEQGRFPKGMFKDKLVVVGASAPSLQDLHPTSTTGDNPMPGPEIQANAADTALRGFPLSGAPGVIDVALIVLLGVAAPLLALRMAAPKAVLITIGLVALFLVAAQLLFNGGTIVKVVYPLVAAGLSAAATVILYAISAAFERERARDAFARFVPESVVGQVLDQADGVRLGGVRADSTVLFSDLRGFTSFAEPLEPDQVISILNRYLTAMSDAILDNGGTLVAYMGDGIMAVFGAPLRQDDHADRALAASEDMLGRFDEFNEWLRAEGLGEGFKMGIGLNSGPVMSGNVGSERRLEYTAIGDTTNTAARLEGMTKGTPWQLYLADSTRESLQRPREDLEAVGEFEVRGREAKIRLWTLPGTRHREPAAAPAAAVPEVTG